MTLADDTSECSENDCVGNPGEGSRERGERLLDGASEALVALLDRVAER